MAVLFNKYALEQEGFPPQQQEDGGGSRVPREPADRDGDLRG